MMLQVIGVAVTAITAIGAIWTIRRRRRAAAASTDAEKSASQGSGVCTYLSLSLSLSFSLSLFSLPPSLLQNSLFHLRIISRCVSLIIFYLDTFHIVMRPAAASVLPSFILRRDAIFRVWRATPLTCYIISVLSTSAYCTVTFCQVLLFAIGVCEISDFHKKRSSNYVVRNEWYR